MYRGTCRYFTYLRTQTADRHLKTAKSEKHLNHDDGTNLLSSLVSFSQTMTTPTVPPSGPSRSCAVPPIRPAARLIQWYALQNTWHIGHLLKMKRFNIAASSAALRSRLAASSANTGQAPTINDGRRGSDLRLTTTSKIRTTHGHVATTTETQNY